MTNARNQQRRAGAPGQGAWFTTLTGIRESTPVWAEIAHYEEPVRRFLARRYPQVPPADRDDLVQSILLSMHERIVPLYKVGLGRFRAYLETAIHRRVVDWFRARRRATPASTLGADLDAEPAEPNDTETAALDLEAELLRAIHAFHDRLTFGTDRERTMLRCFGLRVLQGLPEKQIAGALQLNRDQVKYLLKSGRGQILTELCRGMLHRSRPDPPTALAGRAADLLRQGLRTPGSRAAILDGESDVAVRQAAESLLDAIGAARTHFVGFDTAAGAEFLRALEAIFQSP